MTDPNYIIEARRLADEGYGWHDICVRLKHKIALKTAKQIVLEQAYRRQFQAKRQEA